MFFELLNDLFIHSSIFHFYFGIVLATVGVIHLFSVQHSLWRTRTNLIINEHKHIKITTEHIEKIVVVNDSFMTWLIKTYRRINKRDGKEDAPSSYFKDYFKIRGGKKWKETAYSLAKTFD